MDNAIKAGTILSGFKLMENGPTCSEPINGKLQILKKIQASQANEPEPRLISIGEAKCI
jgi:hypothetical protein